MDALMAANTMSFVLISLAFAAAAAVGTGMTIFYALGAVAIRSILVPEARTTACIGLCLHAVRSLIVTMILVAVSIATWPLN